MAKMEEMEQEIKIVGCLDDAYRRKITGIHNEGESQVPLASAF